MANGLNGYESVISGALDSMFFPGLAAVFIGFLILFITILLIALYVYWALVYMSLAKKLGYKDIAWLAWIPIANVFLIPIMAGKKWAWGFMFLVPVANIVFFLIWSWKIFELRKYPSWLCLAPLIGIIPYMGWAATIGTIIIWGIVAWNDR